MSSIQVRWGNYEWPDPEINDEHDPKPLKVKLKTKEFGDTDECLIPALAFFLKKVEDPRFDWVELRSDVTGWDFMEKGER